MRDKAMRDKATEVARNAVLCVNGLKADPAYKVVHKDYPFVVVERGEDLFVVSRDYDSGQMYVWPSDKEATPIIRTVPAVEKVDSLDFSLTVLGAMMNSGYCSVYAPGYLLIHGDPSPYAKSAPSHLGGATYAEIPTQLDWNAEDLAYTRIWLKPKGEDAGVPAATAVDHARLITPTKGTEMWVETGGTVEEVVLPYTVRDLLTPNPSDWHALVSLTSEGEPEEIAITLSGHIAWTA